MNYLRVHAAAKRRFLANKDICGLLNNGRHRCAKKKDKGPVPAKNFGILSRALSFKVLFNGESEGDEDGIVVIPIGRTKELYSTKQSKAKKKTSVSKVKKGEGEGEEEITSNIQQGKNDAFEQPTKKPEPQPEQDRKTIQNAPKNNNPAKNEESKVNNNNCLIQPKINHHQNQATNFLSKNTNQRHQPSFAGVNNPTSLNHTEVTPTEHPIPPDFNAFSQAGYETPSKNGTPHKMLSFDSVIVPDLQQDINDTTSLNIFNNFNGSIGFTAGKNQFRAGPDTMSPFDFTSVQYNFSETSNKKNVSSKTCESGWSLDTPDISKSISSTEHPSFVSIKSLKTFEPTEESRSDHFIITTPNQFASTPDSIQPTFNYTSAAIPSTFNPNINKSDLMDLPKLTMEMVIKRKQLGARRAYERLFGTKRPIVNTSHQNSTVSSHSTYRTKKKQTKLQPTSTFGSFNTRIGAIPASINSIEMHAVCSDDSYEAKEETASQCTTFGSFNTHIAANSSIQTIFKTSKGKKMKTKAISTLTKERVMQRKRLAARNSLNRLFRERYKYNESKSVESNNNDYEMKTKNNDFSTINNAQWKDLVIDPKLRTTHLNVFKPFLSFSESAFNESIDI